MTAIDDKPRRLFLAIRPPRQTIDHLQRLNRAPQDGVRWSQADNWHVTLRFFGSAEPSAVIDAIDATELPPDLLGDVDLGPAVTRLGRVAVLPARGLEQLARTVSKATEGLGTNDETRPFFGHLTLARLRNEQTPCDLIGHRLRALFPWSTIELIASDHASGRSHYTTIHQWSPAT
ncbi:MAG: 2'-5' RNA ligase family protein [Acidimicrobiales bacterium]